MARRNKTAYEDTRFVLVTIYSCRSPHYAFTAQLLGESLKMLTHFFNAPYVRVVCFAAR